MSRSALILFAHGARDPEWALPMQRVAARIRQTQPDCRVELAFLEFMRPELADCVHQLVAEGFAELTVLPMFIAQGGHLRRQVPEMLAALRQAHPGVLIRLELAVGESEAVIDAMAAHALSLAAPSGVKIA